MKKSIFFIATLAVAFVSCKKEGLPVNPGTQNPVNEEEEEFVEPVIYTSHITTGVSYDDASTKAVYADADLKLGWELGDKVLVMKGRTETPTSNNTTNRDKVSVNGPLGGVLDNTTGSIDVFSGEVNSTCPSETFAVHHFIYPAEAGMMDTSIKRYTSWFTTYYDLESNASIKIPSSQDGRWRPYAYGSCAQEDFEKGFSMKPLNACLAFKVYENDKVTPKKVSTIIINASNNIVGSYKGNFSKTEQSEVWSWPIESFDFDGESKSITATNLETLPLIGETYEYRFNIAANVDPGVIEVTLTDEDGFSITRHVAAKAEGTQVGHKRNVKIYWDGPIDMGATTWYEQYDETGDSNLEGGKLYTQSSITKNGTFTIYMNDQRIQQITDAKAGDSINAEYSMPSGEYRVYSTLVSDGVTYTSNSKTVKVTKKPSIISWNVRSSYSNNGVTNRTNDITGNVINYTFTTADLDDYTNSLITESGIYRWDNSSNVPSLLNSGWISPERITIPYANLGTYKLGYMYKLASGREVKSDVYTTYVTGIPIKDDLTKNKGNDELKSHWKASSGNLKWNDSGSHAGAQVGDNNPNVMLLNFYVPEPFQYVATVHGELKAPGSQAGKMTFAATLGNRNDLSSEGEQRTIWITGDKWYDNIHYVDVLGEFSDTYNQVRLEKTGGPNGGCAVIKSVEILYR